MNEMVQGRGDSDSVLLATLRVLAKRCSVEVNTIITSAVFRNKRSYGRSSGHSAGGSDRRFCTRKIAVNTLKTRLARHGLPSRLFEPATCVFYVTCCIILAAITRTRYRCFCLFLELASLEAMQLLEGSSPKTSRLEYLVLALSLPLYIITLFDALVSAFLRQS